MGDSNVELYRRSLEAFNRGDIEGFLSHFDEDAELYDPDLPSGGRYRGRGAVRRFLKEVLEGFEEARVVDYELFPVGDRVVALTHTYLRGRRGGIEVEIRDAHTFTFREGKIIYWRLYLDRGEALADAGLPTRGDN